MGPRFEVHPEDLATLADRCIDFAIGLTSVVSESAGDLTLAAGDAGDTSGGYATTAVYGPCVEAAQAAIEALAAVFEADAEALMLCAFAFSDMDEAAAKRFLTSSHGPDPRPRYGPR
ncbi:hypothetical protein [Nocardia sp. NPDC019395]|uniref:hypothetical protein n=1 Tax=Nocardia sp. NPDC019395 TaxID=3154686 RepID=UPI003410F065